MSEEVVYRYMKYSEFLDIIRFRRLTLKYPGVWPDKLEALLLKSFEDEVTLNELIKTYGHNHNSYNNCDIKSDLKTITSLLIRIRCQCWTHKEDDLVLWNERNSNEVVRITVPLKCFEDCEYSIDKKRLIHKDVEYISKIDITTVLDFFEKDRTLSRLVLAKKQVFDYEAEHRVILLPCDYSFQTSSHGDSLSDSLLRHFYGIKGEFGFADCYLPFDIKNIKSVKVCPTAQNDFANLVKKDCEEVGLTYDGVSSLLS